MTNSVRRHNASLLAGYLDWLDRDKDLEASTVFQYGKRLGVFIRDIGDMPIGAVSLETLRDWVARPRKKLGGAMAKPATRAFEVSVLSAFYEYLQAEKHVTQNPTVLLVSPRVRNTNPRPISDDAWKRIWFCDRLPDHARVVFGLAFFATLRREEIFRLGSPHVLTGAQTLVGFRRKGGGDDILDYGELLRVYEEVLPHLIGDRSSFLRPLHALVEEGRSRHYLIDFDMLLPARSWKGTVIADANRRRRSHALPPGMTDPQRVYRAIGRWLEQAGLPADSLKGLHVLRHACCTNLLRAGTPLWMVTKVMNHTSPATTQRYFKVSGQDIRDWRKARAQHVDELAMALGVDLATLRDAIELARSQQAEVGEILPPGFSRHGGAMAHA